MPAVQARRIGSLPGNGYWNFSSGRLKIMGGMCVGIRRNGRKAKYLDKAHHCHIIE